MESSNKQIVFICGAPNAGKSTVGKLLAEKLHAAFVEGDDIRKIFYWKTVEQARPEIIEAIAAVVRDLAKSEQPIVVSYPLWPDDYEPLMSYLKGVDRPMHFIALNPSLETALTNRGTRPLEAWELDWIKESYAKKVNNPSFAQTIDNTDTPPTQTVKKVLELLK